MRGSGRPRVVILGAGFGGLELATLLSEAFGEGIDVTLIERADSFVFGYSKLDVMFGRATPDAVRLAYAGFAKPGVRFLRRTVRAIDPAARRVTTEDGAFDADFLIVALGADYDLAATPGMAEAGEFYSVAGAERMRDAVARFAGGKALIGVADAPYKCPPAPSECALMLHDHLVARGLRPACEIELVLPLPTPIPPSPETSQAILAAFGERGIAFSGGRRVARVDNGRRVAVLDDGSERAFDLFLGVPKHRVPAVVEASGLAENGWIPVDPRTLRTRFENVFAVGDGANTGTPKAGVFAEGAARAVAATIAAAIRGGAGDARYDGAGICYIEFGGGRVGKVEVDFFSGPKPTGKHHDPSPALRADKDAFGASRRRRWFGLPG
ncbi:MAG: NAD(P)/FAD-dependent oxidoreductase [Bauldia sp.]